MESNSRYWVRALGTKPVDDRTIGTTHTSNSSII